MVLLQKHLQDNFPSSFWLEKYWFVAFVLSRTNQSHCAKTHLPVAMIRSQTEWKPHLSFARNQIVCKNTNIFVEILNDFGVSLTYSHHTWDIQYRKWCSIVPVFNIMQYWTVLYCTVVWCGIVRYGIREIVQKVAIAISKNITTKWMRTFDFVRWHLCQHRSSDVCKDCIMQPRTAVRN